MTIRFERHPQVQPDWPGEFRAPPLTWDYLKAKPEISDAFAHDLAHATCDRAHTCRIVGNVHTIAADGTLSPSYVCPVAGCTFHDHVQFVGWGQP